MAAENEISLTDIAAFLPETIRVESATPATEEEETTAEKSEATEDSGNDESAPSVQEEVSTTDEEKQEEDSKEGEKSSDEEDDEEDDDAEDGDEEDTEKGDARSAKADKLLKRIDKLTAKRREAEEALDKTREEADKLRTELAAASKVVLQPTPEDPLSDVETTEDLDARLAAAKRVRTWALTNRDGATVKGSDGNEEYVDAAEMARHLAAADAIVTDHGPARRSWLAQRETSRAEAQAAYPAFFTQGSSESKALRDILKQYPAMGKYPNVELIIGDALVGQQARMARQEAQAKAKSASAPAASLSRKAQSPAPEPPKVTGKSKIPAKTAREAASLKKALQGGDRDSVADLMESLLG